ncbi:MAG: prepilin-type N-terminal cleavage/methylation domain-containing protein [Deltaproteobacteria bacterium]|nr:prepilin-type N-terminal cleavage/methylation domain-containing protein [Deltaproteobacteria bacterium]
MRHEAEGMRERGFTLLEVMVAIGVLAVCMSAIVGVNVGAMAMTSRTKGYTVAAMLARSKMIDVEESVREKGFPDFDEREEGDFSEENYPEIKWASEILKIKLPAPDLSGGADLGGSLAKLQGRDSSQVDSLGLTPMGGDANMLMSGLPMLLDQLEKAIREVRVTITWTEGKKEQSFSVTTHIVNIPGAEVGVGVTQVIGGQPGAMPGAIPGMPGGLPGPMPFGKGLPPPVLGR